MKYLKPLRENRSTDVPNIQEALTIVKAHCTQWASNPEGPQLYRGRALADYRFDVAMVTDPNGAYRRSRAGEKFAAYMRRDAAWSAYPDRNASIMAGTDHSITDQFSNGISYVVIPYDNATIALCPSADFNYSDYHSPSFPHFNRIVGESEPRSLLNTLWYEGSKAKDEGSPDILMPTIAALYVPYTLTEKFCSDLYAWAAHEKKAVNHLLEAFYSSYAEHKEEYPSILKFFSYLCDPKENAFNVDAYSKMREHFPGKYEAWTDSKCLLVNVKDLDELVYKLQK